MWLAWIVLQVIGQSGVGDSLEVIRLLRRESERLCLLRGRAEGTPYARKAAFYIARRFRQMGYTVRIDTFSTKLYRLTRVKVWISSDGRRWVRLREGKDFVPWGGSPSIRGEWTVDTTFRADCACFTSRSRDEALPQARTAHCPVLIFSRSKLIATVSREKGAFPIIYLKDSIAFPKRIRIRIHGAPVQALSRNVSAYLRGLSSDSAWVVGAHYDHIGYLGRATFWGGNDNSSGTAFLLALADQLRKAPQPPPYDVWIVAFGAEEWGLLGSFHWTKYPPYPLEQLRGMLNFDMVGCGEKGVAVVGAKDQSHFWSRIDSARSLYSERLPVSLHPISSNSDHYPFYEKGVPALFFYLEGGPGFYHDIYDRPESLNWMRAYDLLRWIRDVLYQP